MTLTNGTLIVWPVTALKVKLMLRRPINQLVAQGIMPREYKIYNIPAYYSLLPFHYSSNCLIIYIFIPFRHNKILYNMYVQ